MLLSNQKGTIVLSGRSGIYMLTNMITDKIYIGQTNDLNRRACEYRRIDNPTTPIKSRPIDVAIREYTGDAFEFEVLKFCPVNELEYWEKYYIKKYNALDPNIGYNNAASYLNGTRDPSDEMRKRMSESHTGLTETADTNRKKSNMIYAIDEENKIIYVYDSARLFASTFYDKPLSKDMVKNSLRQPSKCRGFRLYYVDPQKRFEIYDKQRNKPSLRDPDYLKFAEALNQYSVETIGDNGVYQVIYKTYENTIMYNYRSFLSKNPPSKDRHRKVYSEVQNASTWS